MAILSQQKSCAELLKPAAVAAPVKADNPAAPAPQKTATQSQESEKNQKNASDNLKS
jgi:hypothetical protein